MSILDRMRRDTENDRNNYRPAVELSSAVGQTSSVLAWF
jgi:hypothetical protein